MHTAQKQKDQTSIILSSRFRNVRYNANIPSLIARGPPLLQFTEPAKILSRATNLVRITPFMFNCRFHMAKRPLRQDAASCIAFWGVSTHKTGRLPPESLQRFCGGLRAGSCGVWFRPVFASCGLFRYLAPPVEVHPIR